MDLSDLPILPFDDITGAFCSQGRKGVWTSGLHITSIDDQTDVFDSDGHFHPAVTVVRAREFFPTFSVFGVSRRNRPGSGLFQNSFELAVGSTGNNMQCSIERILAN